MLSIHEHQSFKKSYPNFLCNLTRESGDVGAFTCRGPLSKEISRVEYWQSFSNYLHRNWKTPRFVFHSILYLIDGKELEIFLELRVVTKWNKICLHVTAVMTTNGNKLEEMYELRMESRANREIIVKVLLRLWVCYN